MKAKKYIWSMICVYMAYLTHGMQALIFSQNQVNFATKWGFDMSNPESAAYAAGVAAVSTAIAWTGFGKFISVWIGGEISDRVGRKKLMIGGAILYIICFATMFVTNNATVAAITGLLGGIATSGFWDASGYPAVQEAYPAAPGSALIMIKFFVALSSIFYPLICVQTAAAGNWKINIVIPLVLSCVVLVFACIARFVYDDEKAANAGSGSDKRADQAEIDAAKARQLVDAIADETYTINPFFKSRLPEEIDYDFIESGAHIDRMYEEFSSIQKNKVTFLGYNFYGVGGTVFATRSLAEALLEKNYLVELLSLKCTAKPKEMPYGLQLTALYKANSRRKIELLKRGFFRWKGLYGHLDCDCSRQNLSPYAGMAMRKKLENINSKTVISTRESLHLFLNDATSEKIEEKIYFFHCTAALVNELFPDIVNKMEKIDIGKAVFVSEENRQLYLDKFNFKNYKDYIVLGNTLESSRSVAREDIGAEEEDDNKKKIDVPERDYFLGMYLLRISHEREADINNLIGFAKYLKEQNVDDIVIDVYGTGDYLNEFLDKIFDNEVEDYICYCGETSNPKNQMKNHDAVVDFTLNHSFGMPYIEAILNGKMVYCTENTGSREVLNGIDGCIYTSYADLLDKIRKFPQVTDDQLRSNYDKISKVYSREVLGEKFVDFLEK